MIWLMTALLSEYKTGLILLCRRHCTCLVCWQSHFVLVLTLLQTLPVKMSSMQSGCCVRMAPAASCLLCFASGCCPDAATSCVTTFGAYCRACSHDCIVFWFYQAHEHFISAERLSLSAAIDATQTLFGGCPFERVLPVRTSAVSCSILGIAAA